MNPSWLIQQVQTLFPDGESIAGDVLGADGVLDSQQWLVMSLVNGQGAYHHGQLNQQGRGKALRFEP